MWTYRFALLTITASVLLSSQWVEDTEAQLRRPQQQPTQQQQIQQQPAVQQAQQRGQPLQVSELEGMDVVNEHDEQLGSVNRVVEDTSDGQIYIIVGIGGFLGLGQKEIALVPQNVHVNNDGQLVVRGLTDNEIENMPAHWHDERYREVQSDATIHAQSVGEGEVSASRMFVGPQEYPPEEFAGYGIVVFPALAVTAELRDRFVNACAAYLGTLEHPSAVFAPIREQMVTVWPVKAGDIARELDSARTTVSSICEKATEQYHLETARVAIRHARRTIEDATAKAAILSGRGPFLLAWRPSSMKGERDALVLSADLSDISEREEFVGAFGKWRDDVESSPEFWPPLVENETEQAYKDRIRQWADTWGSKIKIVVFGGAS